MRHLSWLAAGAALLLVSNGRWMVAAAVWLALPCWLVYVDRSPRWRGLGMAFLVWTTVFLVAWQGLVPAPGWIYVAIVVAYALAYFLAIVAHRLVASRLTGVAATLVFPLAWVSVEFAFQRWVTPYGSWLSVAYSQTDLALLQATSVGGAAAVSFLITWFAGSAALALRGDRRWRPMLPCVAAVATVLVWGQFRLARAPHDVEGIRTASLVPSPALAAELDGTMAGVSLHERPVGDVLADVGSQAAALNEDLLRRTEREARAGARVVAWSETAGRVFPEGEAELLRRASAIAAAERAALVLAYGVWTPGGSPPLRNAVTAIRPDGTVAWTYEKAHPIVGPESPLMDPGSGRIESIDLPSGSLGAAICHDLDFPRLLRQAARDETDLIVGPSADWPIITDMHARMARLRAIEFGFSLVRPTQTGRTLAVDPWGRIHASVDHATDVVVAHVPVGGVSTVYGATGDWLGWAALGGLLSLLYRARRGTSSTAD
ncbi:MAG: hypothetical protein OEU54_01635 [Gemmatimonadota bacterium]|nr:hypothetical protein [Gemmatimonadota bacterium]